MLLSIFEGTSHLTSETSQDFLLVCGQGVYPGFLSLSTNLLARLDTGEIMLNGRITHYKEKLKLFFVMGYTAIQHYFTSVEPS